MNHNDYLGAGFRVFPLWPLDKGRCTCDDEECNQGGKHPRVRGWQNTPHWSDEQIDVMESTGQLKTGFGVCVDGLVIDIDPRNGGDDSYAKLKEDTGLDFEELSNLVVRTGGGGLHIYFSLAEPIAMVQHLKDYPGIDFKSSGFVVGAGSLHASGQLYEGEGDPSELTEPPAALVQLLKKPDSYRASTGSNFIDVTESEIADLLSHISPDVDYETWINIGMAIHDATHGSAFELWDSWSAKGSKYDAKTMDRHWQSFGKCSNPVTIGTLIHHAEEGGYKRPVVFHDLPEEMADPLDTSCIDLLRPPGFVGEVAQWINGQCRFPREHLAVATAINTIGNLGGLRHYDDRDKITGNTFVLCVAGSGTGKDAIIDAGTDLMRAAKIGGAMHGNIKSEQEITRNIIRHQAAYYVIDEFGYFLQKIESARKRGGAAYLDGVIANLMSMFTKANSYFLVGGDLKDEIRKELLRELALCDKKISENEDQNGKFARLQKHLLDRAIPSVDDGIENPFISLMGYSTPETFDQLVTGENAQNGFIGRCFLVRERETNPRMKKGFKKPELEQDLAMQVRLLAHGGISHDQGERVEWYGKKTAVQTNNEASAMLDKISDYFHDEAERQKSITGLEAIPRRGYELVAKISYILAMHSRLREPEHVRWAFAMVKRDIAEKLRLAQSNILSDSLNANDQGTVLRNKIIDVCSGEDGESLSVIKKKCGRKYNATDIEGMIDKMLEANQLGKVEKQTKGRPSLRYKAL